MRRLLYLVHRWLGISTCLLFSVWFVSGLVMLYVPFPGLTKAERLAGLAAIDWSKVSVQPASVANSPRRMILEVRGAAPVWRVTPWHGIARAVLAQTGVSSGRVGEAEARRIAGSFGHSGITAIELLTRDQWTVAGGFDDDRPLWKASLAGSGGHELYIASTSGEVVLDTSARERMWNWLGSVPHWIYPTILRQDNALWRGVVMWVAGPCIVGAVTGIWIGILRMRLGARRYRGRRTTPYRGWMRWHHIAGLVGGTFLTTWIISGWLSVDPGRLFDSPGLSDASRAEYAGASTVPQLDYAKLAHIAPDARRIELFWTAGTALLSVEGSDAARILDAVTLRLAHPDAARMIAAAARAVPGGKLVAVDRLTEPDSYWYEAGSLPILPVLRLRFDDPARTWVHIDPATGELLGSLDSRRRLYRWAFDLLHKWDLNGLTLNRPAWDVVIWLLSLLGLTTSVTGVWIGWKRLRR